MGPIPIKIKDLISAERIQYLIIIGISIAVLGFTAILYFLDHSLFQRFLGTINPIVAFLIVIILSIILFSIFFSQNWFTIYEKGNLQGIRYGICLSAILAIVMILVDTKIIFPADLNILYPKSLLFYPAIGFFVEILFHVLPLAVILLILNGIFRNTNFEYLVWISMFVVALIEPIYHTTFMASVSRYPPWAIAYVGFHIFLINFLQLALFRKYDFISMYSFRLAYYLVWHVVWGCFRLKLLF